MCIFKPLALIAVLFLSACAAPGQDYIYDPPAKNAPACLSACEQGRKHCRAAALEPLEQCRQDRDFVQRNYETCVQTRGSTGQGSCAPVQICPPPDERPCIDEYNICYESCGGRVMLAP